MKFILIIMPIFIIFGTGYFGQKTFKLKIKSISTMALYLMTPFLVFDTFYSHTLNMDYLYMFLLSTLLVTLLTVMTMTMGKVINADRTHMSAMLLGTIFPNSGNYGAPVVLFALGSLAFDYAIIFMVIQAFLINSIGIFIASYGSKESATIRIAVINVIKMPVLYGAMLGIALQFVHHDLPSTIVDGISLVGSAAIPTVMLILGMQLAEIKRQKFRLRYINVVTIIRMIVSPLVAVLLVSFMPVSDIIKSVFVILSAMPVAANTIMLAVQFDVKADLLSVTTLVTTLLSILTIPFILYLLGI